MCAALRLVLVFFLYIQFDSFVEHATWPHRQPQTACLPFHDTILHMAIVGALTGLIYLYAVVMLRPPNHVLLWISLAFFGLN